MLTFPITLTWAEIAALPGAADAFSWDDSMIDEDYTGLDTFISYYNDSMSESLKLYLTQIGYDLTDTGVTIRNERALHTASAIFAQIMFEYDAVSETDDPTHVALIEIEQHGYKRLTTPTWAMFNLGGDDDCDYSGSQPSCLTDLLLQQIEN